MVVKVGAWALEHQIGGSKWSLEYLWSSAMREAEHLARLLRRRFLLSIGGMSKCERLKS